MKLRKIKTLTDIEIVKSFFYKIFLDESGYDLIHFKDAITGCHNYKRLEFYLGYVNHEAIGLTGIYANQDDECWLGWFGICPEYRHKGYATKMLDLTINMMENYGYKVCRIYTDTVNNATAIKLYVQKGFKINSTYQQNIITMAKELENDVAISKWRGKPLGFVPEWPISS